MSFKLGLGAGNTGILLVTKSKAYSNVSSIAKIDGLEKETGDRIQNI